MDISDPHATDEGLQGTTFQARLGKGWEKESGELSHQSIVTNAQKLTVRCVNCRVLRLGQMGCGEV